MNFRIECVEPIQMIGICEHTTLRTENPAKLWGQFMPRRKEITNRIEPNLYSVQIFDNFYAQNAFSRDAYYTKWAAVAIASNDCAIPEGMSELIIPAGQYAVFVLKGTYTQAVEILGRIYNNWLPASEFEVDNRPNFTRFDQNHKIDDEDAQETFWLPVRSR